MEEITKDVLESAANGADTESAFGANDENGTVANTVAAETTDVTANGQDGSEASAKKKIKLPAGLKKISDYLNAHENLRQMVFFLLFSFVCFAIEYLSYTILSLCLKSVNSPIDWFVFKYPTTAGGLGAFIAFLISNVIAQICTFVLNRKKTFNATNNVVVSGILYAVIVIIIIVLNTYLGGVINEAIAKSSGDNPAMVTFGGYVGKFVGSFLSFVINFLGCKFLVMRDWGKKKREATAQSNANETICEQSVTSNPLENTASDADVLAQAAADKTE